MKYNQMVDLHSPALYQLSNVKKDRSKGGITFTLCVPEFLVRSGEFWAVVGSSGCGKSTLLDLLALVLAPTSAARFIMNPDKAAQGLDMQSLSDHAGTAIRRNHIGYILQNGGLLSFLSVRDNILLPAALNSINISNSDFNSLVELLGLGDQLAKKPQYLSGGQRQRVAVARALVHRPSIVLADEPTAAVDSQTARDIVSELHLLSREMGATVIMVTHNPGLINTTADARVDFEVIRHSGNQTTATTSIQRLTNSVSAEMAPSSDVMEAET